MARTPICRRRGQQPEAAHVSDTPESPDKPTFPRRFPRLGSQFQTKISKSNEPLERPPPECMSTEYPHLAEVEVKQEAIEHNGMYFILFFPFHDRKNP
jgi:hypothetical protein